MGQAQLLKLPIWVRLSSKFRYFQLLKPPIGQLQLLKPPVTLSRVVHFTNRTKYKHNSSGVSIISGLALFIILIMALSTYYKHKFHKCTPRCYIYQIFQTLENLEGSLYKYGLVSHNISNEKDVLFQSFTHVFFSFSQV